MTNKVLAGRSSCWKRKMARPGDAAVGRKNFLQIFKFFPFLFIYIFLFIGI